MGSIQIINHRALPPPTPHQILYRLNQEPAWNESIDFSLAAAIHRNGIFSTCTLKAQSNRNKKQVHQYQLLYKYIECNFEMVLWDRNISREACSKHNPKSMRCVYRSHQYLQQTNSPGKSLYGWCETRAFNKGMMQVNESASTNLCALPCTCTK